MTIATNNGVPIIQNGKFVTSCACCGGWYCCPPAECALDIVNSVVVTISPVASEWRKNIRSNSACYSEDSKSYDYRTLAVPTSSLSGSHMLQKFSPTVWTKNLGVDSDECLSPVITLELHSYSGSSGVWRFVTANPAYYWYKKTKSESVGYKSLSDMQCQPTGPWARPAFEYCSGYEEDFEEYNHGSVLKSSFVSFECGGRGTSQFSHQLGFIQPSAGFVQNLLNPQFVEAEFGSLSCSVSVTIS